MHAWGDSLRRVEVPNIPGSHFQEPDASDGGKEYLWMRLNHGRAGFKASGVPTELRGVSPHAVCEYIVYMSYLDSSELQG